MSDWLVDAANILASVASLVSVAFGALVWRMTRATWTALMTVGFGLLCVVRVGIAVRWSLVDPFSRSMSGLVHVLFAIAFIVLWWNMRRFYHSNGDIPDNGANGDQAARMVRLAEGAAAKTAQAAAKTAEASDLAVAIANESQRAATAANESTEESRK